MQHGGTTYADMLKSGEPPVSHFTNNFVFVLSPSDHPHHFGDRVSSGRVDQTPFSLEEITALTFDIVQSLRGVQDLPRQDVFMAVMNVAFKYLYRANV